MGRWAGQFYAHSNREGRCVRSGETLTVVPSTSAA